MKLFNLVFILLLSFTVQAQDFLWGANTVGIVEKGEMSDVVYANVLFAFGITTNTLLINNNGVESEHAITDREVGEISGNRCEETIFTDQARYTLGYVNGKLTTIRKKMNEHPDIVFVYYKTTFKPIMSGE